VTAQDIRYGRRGGRTLHPQRDSVRDALEAISRARHAGFRDGSWPQHSVEMWREIAAEAEKKVAAGEPLTWADREAISLMGELKESAA
jgi:hypothetical protein